MKITGNYFNTQINKKNIQSQSNVEKPAFKGHLQNMDSITISATKQQIAESQFVNSLKSHISAEVKTSTPPEELDNLAGQISRGEYEIGANEIAKKILLAGSES